MIIARRLLPSVAAAATVANADRIVDIAAYAPLITLGAVICAIIALGVRKIA